MFLVVGIREIVVAMALHKLIDPLHGRPPLQPEGRIVLLRTARLKSRAPYLRESRLRTMATGAGLT
jgi:hypothetical protein